MANQHFSEDNFRKQAEADGITHISTGVAITRDGKILLVRRATHDYLGGNYELPGGGVDEGETITEGASREVKEETGLTVSSVVTTFDGFDYSTNRKPSVRQVNFLVRVEPGDVKLQPEEHDAYLWVGPEDIKTINMSDDMRKCVTNALALVA